jgi:Na+/proline symporter
VASSPPPSPLPAPHLLVVASTFVRDIYEKIFREHIGIYELIPAFALSTLTIVVVTLLSSANPEDTPTRTE